MYNESVASNRRTDASDLRNATNDGGNTAAENGFQTGLGIHMALIGQSTESRSSTSVSLSSESEEESLPVNLVPSDLYIPAPGHVLSLSADQEWVDAVDATADDTVGSMYLAADANTPTTTEAAAGRPSAGTSENTEEDSQKSDATASDLYQAQAEDEVDKMCRPLRYCTLFTALQKPSLLPVLELHRTADETQPQKAAGENASALSASVEGTAEKTDTMPDCSVLATSKTNSPAIGAARGIGSASAEVVLPQLIIRVGRPLKSTFIQRLLGKSPERRAENPEEFGDWWTSHISQALRAESVARSSQGAGELLPEVCFLIGEKVSVVVYFVAFRC